MKREENPVGRGGGKDSLDLIIILFATLLVLKSYIYFDVFLFPFVLLM